MSAQGGRRDKTLPWVRWHLRVRLDGSVHLAGPQVLRGQDGGSGACFPADKSCKKFTEELGWGHALGRNGLVLCSCPAEGSCASLCGCSASPAAQGQAQSSCVGDIQQPWNPFCCVRQRNDLSHVTSAPVLDERWNFCLRESPSAVWDEGFQVCPQSQAQGTWAAPAFSTAWTCSFSGRVFLPHKISQSFYFIAKAVRKSKIHSQPCPLQCWTFNWVWSTQKLHWVLWPWKQNWTPLRR